MALGEKIFEHEERYRELLKRQGELVDLLDIAKNQAAANQATESKEGVEVAPVEANVTDAGEEAEKVDIAEVKTAPKAGEKPSTGAGKAQSGTTVLTMPGKKSQRPPLRMSA